jgi:hypothetical protein
MTSSKVGITLVAIAIAALTTGGCINDPVQDTRSKAFGTDFPAGVEATAYHRPGQPCTACHSTRGGVSPRFSVAGTIFWGSCNVTAAEYKDEKVRAERCDLTPVDGAEVRIRGSNGGEDCAVTNCAGNFSFDDNVVNFPFLVSVSKRVDGKLIQEAQMGGHISREGSCAGCHDNPRRSESPGQVFLFAQDDATGKIGIPDSVKSLIASERGKKCPDDTVPARRKCAP